MKGNQVLLIGYVGSVLSATVACNGNKRVAMRVATHYPVKNEQDEKKWKTVWHDVVAWENTAAYAERTFVKGSKIMVDGSISYRTYSDKQGQKRYLTQINAVRLMNLDR